MLSNGLMNQAKRLDRVVLALPKILEKLPNAILLLLGREHPTEPLAGKQTKFCVCKSPINAFESLEAPTQL